MESREAITSRVVEFLGSTKKTVRKIAIETGLNQPTLQRTVKGENKLSVEVLSAIANAFPELSAEWLLRGKGEMLMQLPLGSEILALNEVITDLTNTIKEKNKTIAILREENENLRKEINNK